MKAKAAIATWREKQEESSQVIGYGIRFISCVLLRWLWLPYLFFPTAGLHSTLLLFFFVGSADLE